MIKKIYRNFSISKSLIKIPKLSKDLKIKNIIFDFDGVIADTFEIALLTEKEINPDTTREEYKNRFNGNYWKNEKTKNVNENDILRFERLYSERIKKVPISPAMKDVVEKLSEKYKLFIISSGGEDVIKSYLEKNKVLGNFQEVFGRKANLSKVEKFKMIFKKYQTKKEECIFITDTLGDIFEGKEVGVKIIAVSWGAHDIPTLMRGFPDLIVKGHLGLLNAIENS